MKDEEIAAPNNNGWQPKETAPKDGSWFLVIEKYPEGMCWSPYEFAAWQVVTGSTLKDGILTPYKSEYFGGTDTSDEIDFDWWQPLPALPTL